MFQFPPNPLVGQTFTPVPGVTYMFNGTGWAPVSTVYGRGLFDDGTLAAPGIAWANEPTMGWRRGSVNTTNFVINGANILGIQPVIFSLGAGVNLRMNGGAIQASAGSVGVPGWGWMDDSTSGFYYAGAQDIRLALGGVFKAQFTVGGMGYVGSITASTIMQAPCVAATGAFGVANQPAGSACLFAGGMSVRGNAANAYGPVQLNATDGIGGTNVYQWLANASSSLGRHQFKSLIGSDGNASLVIYGGNNGTGNGASHVFDYAGETCAIFDMRLADGTPGARKAEMHFCIRRNAALSGSDLQLGYNSLVSPQLTLKGGWGNALANTFDAPLKVLGSAGAGQWPGICLTGGDGLSGIWTTVSNINYWASQGGGGPISGWAMSLTSAGAAVAASFTPPSDETLKTDITPITGALAAMLQLHGIRYTQTWDNKPSMGFTAQDVEPVFPEVVGETVAPDGTVLKTLNYNALLGPMLEAMRELDARLTALGG